MQSLQRSIGILRALAAAGRSELRLSDVARAVELSKATTSRILAALCDQGLVEESRADESRPLLRGGIASGEALQRAGDWYGRPVNLASRLTSFARRGSVVASGDVHDVADDGYAWSFAGNRRLKGLGEDVPVWRVRPAETETGA